MEDLSLLDIRKIIEALSHQQAYNILNNKENDQMIDDLLRIFIREKDEREEALDDHVRADADLMRV